MAARMSKTNYCALEHTGQPIDLNCKINCTPLKYKTTLNVSGEETVVFCFLVVF